MLALFTAIIILIALAFGWYFAFPILGGIITLTALVWGALILSVVVFCVAILLIFIFTGTGIFVLTIGALIWALLAVIFFPIMFPVIIPLLIILLFISYYRHRQLKKPKDQVEKL